MVLHLFLTLITTEAARRKSDGLLLFVRVYFGMNNPANCRLWWQSGCRQKAHQIKIAQKGPFVTFLWSRRRK